MGWAIFMGGVIVGFFIACFFRGRYIRECEGEIEWLTNTKNFYRETNESLVKINGDMLADNNAMRTEIEMFKQMTERGK